MLIYLSFGGLLILAIGFNILYIVYEKKEIEKGGYFRFLKSIDPTIGIIKELERDRQRAEYWKDYAEKINKAASDTIKKTVEEAGTDDIDVKKLELESRKIFKKFFPNDKDGDLAYDLIKKSVTKETISITKDRFENKTQRFKRVNNLKYIAIISFLYAFCISLVAPYENFLIFDPSAFDFRGTNASDLNKSLYIMNIIVFASAIIYLLLDLFYDWYRSKTILTYLSIITVNFSIFYFFEHTNICLFFLNIIFFIVVMVLPIFLKKNTFISQFLRYKKYRPENIEDHETLDNNRNKALCITFLSLMIAFANDNTSSLSIYKKVSFISNEYNYYITVLVCFLGFVIYTLPSLFCWIYSMKFFFTLPENIKNAKKLMELFDKYENLEKSFVKELKKQTMTSKTINNFTDFRDGRTYSIIKIGNQMWLAENLAFDYAGSSVYNNDLANLAKYGRLYDWETAKKAVPSGWRLPRKDELEELVDFAGSWEISGKKLKAKSGWNDDGNGTDDCNFSALPGGNIHIDNTFHDIGNIGFWWSNDEYDREKAYLMNIECNKNYTSIYPNCKLDKYSIRCVKDWPQK